MKESAKGPKGLRGGMSAVGSQRLAANRSFAKSFLKRWLKAATARRPLPPLTSLIISRLQHSDTSGPELKRRWRAAGETWWGLVLGEG